MPDSSTVKIDALKLGYICCERLKNKQKWGEFEHRLLELNITMPKNTDQIRNKVQSKQNTYGCLRNVFNLK